MLDERKHAWVTDPTFGLPVMSLEFFLPSPTNEYVENYVPEQIFVDLMYPCICRKTPWESLAKVQKGL